jgi:aarF domain-containing kinase
MSDTDEERPSSLLEGNNTSEGNTDDDELKKLRSAVVDREGLIVGIFELLRTVPRYVPAY